MPQYFFHMGQTEAGLDPIGMEFDSDNDAKIEATKAMAEMLKDKAGEFWDERSMTLTVTDQTGMILFVLDLSATEAPAISQRRSGLTEA